MDPLLKWPGGKRRLAEQLSKYVGEVHKKGRYIELFSGGAALYFHLAPKRAVLVDLCKPLISFYEAIKREPVAFSDELDKLLQMPFGEETYLKIRSDWNGHDFGVKFAAKMIYLNKLGFNGLFRLNKSLDYNVAWGKKKALPAFPSRDEIIAYSELLQGAQLHYGDYSTILRSTHKHDVIYADPPYWDMYDRYAGSEFTNAHHKQLADGLFRAVKRGATIISSNIDCPQVRELYSWATIETTPLLHKISCTADSRKVVDEVIITASNHDNGQLEMFK